jgi:hypothetical protein
MNKESHRGLIIPVAQSVINISKSLPRLDAYRRLYPTDRMVQLLAELYAKVLEFLLEAFTYYYRLDWKGSLGIVI